MILLDLCFFVSSRRRHTRSLRDWSSDVCSSDLSQFSNRHAAHRDNRRALPQCFRPHLSQRDQALSSRRDQDQPGTLCTSTRLGGHRNLEFCTKRLATSVNRRAISETGRRLKVVPDVEPNDLTFPQAKDVPDRLVLQPVRLIWQRFTFEIADYLFNLNDNRTIRSFGETHGLDVRTDHFPLSRPVFPNGLAAMNVAAVHTVRPRHIVSEHGKHTVDVSLVESIVDTLQNFNIAVHRISSFCYSAEPLVRPSRKQRGAANHVAPSCLLP